MFRCPSCRTRRKDYGLFTRHVQQSGHALCRCGGYHYEHRPGSPFCEVNPVSPLLLADRYGAGDADLIRAAQHIIEATPSAEAKVRDLLKTWSIYETDENYA